MFPVDEVMTSPAVTIGNARSIFRFQNGGRPPS